MDHHVRGCPTLAFLQGWYHGPIFQVILSRPLVREKQQSRSCLRSGCPPSESRRRVGQPQSWWWQQQQITGGPAPARVGFWLFDATEKLENARGVDWLCT